MKKLLLPIALAAIISSTQAGDGVVAFSSTTSVGVLRGGGNMYRPIPRGGISTNLTSAERYRAAVYRPTQYFYVKDNVVAYRFSGEELSRVGNEFGGTYHGPHAAQFVPSQHQMAPNGRLRSYAAVLKRSQPGVPMISRSTRIRATVDASESTGTAMAAVSTIQLASAR